jgi:hypothetical protein
MTLEESSSIKGRQEVEVDLTRALRSNPPDMPHCVVLLARSRGLEPLRDRLQHAPDVRLIDVGEMLPSPELLAHQNASVLLLGQTIAWSAAGWEFVEHFRLSSSETEIRVLPEHANAIAKLLEGPTKGPVAPTLIAASSPLPRVPARKGVRRPMPNGALAMVNGRNAFLINLSPFGAQVLTPLVLKPGQQVSFGLSDNPKSRVRGSVAWSLYELKGPGDIPHYRVGLSFHEPLITDSE